MKNLLQAACGSHAGKIRKNNEDNFCFGGTILTPEGDAGAEPIVVRSGIKDGQSFAVFDGMGGENFGGLASYAAAKEMAAAKRTWSDRFLPYDEYLRRLVMKLNQAVLDAKAEMMTTRMGTTMVSLSFVRGDVYVCGVGDSRAYCLRDGQLRQLTKDHVGSRPRQSGGKPPLTQYLGIDPEEMLLEPSLMKQESRSGDRYLLCSDGLTDMLTDLEITGIMQTGTDPADCVNRMTAAALERGGRDNITVIVCAVT